MWTTPCGAGCTSSAGCSSWLAGFALLAGKTWGRIIAVILAIVSAFANIGFLGAYPIWSFFMIGIDILVLWALLVHGGELRE